jgi:acetyl-CoA carboxylase biotin carboxyl carrier protein
MKVCDVMLVGARKTPPKRAASPSLRLHSVSSGGEGGETRVPAFARTCARFKGNEGLMAEVRVRSEIAGSVWKIEVAVGDEVSEDDPLVILESMKMEIPLQAPRSGVVKEILVAEGEPIAEGEVVVIIIG